MGFYVQDTQLSITINGIDTDFNIYNGIYYINSNNQTFGNVIINGVENGQVLVVKIVYNTNNVKK